MTEPPAGVAGWRRKPRPDTLALRNDTPGIVTAFRSVRRRPALSAYFMAASRCLAMFWYIAAMASEAVVAEPPAWVH